MEARVVQQLDALLDAPVAGDRNVSSKERLRHGAETAPGQGASAQRVMIWFEDLHNHVDYVQRKLFEEGTRRSLRRLPANCEIQDNTEAGRGVTYSMIFTFSLTTAFAMAVAGGGYKKRRFGWRVNHVVIN